MSVVLTHLAVLVAGIVVGLRLGAKWRRDLREKLRSSEDRHDAWNLQAMATDHDVCGPAVVKPKFFDQDTIIAANEGIEMASRYNSVHIPTPDDGACPRCDGQSGGYIRQGEEWDWDCCSQCRGTGQTPPPDFNGWAAAIVDDDTSHGPRALPPGRSS